MEAQTHTPNRLLNENSPYLLEHAYNPVDWFPWGEEAFEKAGAEDKPVFLSIGYSTCHWCHVMARESFEDDEIAALLNAFFVSVKVDREERPDIDAIYMSVCEAFTGSGGWPTSIFLTPERKPFFAGTYFPKESRYGTVGFADLLHAIHEAWTQKRARLLASADEVIKQLSLPAQESAEANAALLDRAAALYQRSYDAQYGGFGGAPKFPAPHNLLFLLTLYEKSGDAALLRMAETTLTQMYRGGLFDHIGFGFCRYSTDPYFLVPHFEKMLYDNALLMLAYCKAYAVTGKSLYREIAEKTAAYVLREMTAPEGGFYSAQDADSEGVEGKYYVFTPDELNSLLGEETGAAFSRCYGITEEGNFEGKSIPNLLQSKEADPALLPYLPAVYAYRARRAKLGRDDKRLTAWNGLMIAAMCRLYRAGGDKAQLAAAQNAQRFIEERLSENGVLFVSMRAERRGARAFLDAYACYAFALLSLYEATLDTAYLKKAEAVCQRAVSDFWDAENGGFFLSGSENERMILRPKETYDGALPSGNSMMAWCLVRLWLITEDAAWERLAQAQLSFLAGAAAQYPMGHAMFLTALSDALEPPAHITLVPAEGCALFSLARQMPEGAAVRVLSEPTGAYPLKDGKTTYYVCKNHACRPPVNDPAELDETARGREY